MTSQDNMRMTGIVNRNIVSVFTIENTESAPEDHVLPRAIAPLEFGTMQEKEGIKYLATLSIKKSTDPKIRIPRLSNELK